MGKLVVMMGIPASGKSSWARIIKRNEENRGKTCNIVSRDAIRFSMLEDGDEYFDKEDMVFDEYVRQVSLSLLEHDVTIADATHISPTSRRKLINNIAIPPNTAIEFCFMNVSKEEAMKRNSKRDGRMHVPNDAIESMSRNLKLISDEEFNSYLPLFTMVTVEGVYE